MRAIRIDKQGGRENMKLVELPTPAPAAGQALVKIEAAGVNFIDVYQRAGTYQVPLPLTLGMEGAGTVQAIGPGVDSVKPGDRVAWTSLPHSYASEGVFAAERLVPVPAGVSTKTAAAAMLQGLTAHYLMHSTYPLKANSTCLIHAAAGGVGLLFCQMAKKIGARVFGTASGDKGKLALAAGAEAVIDYTKVDFEAEVKRLTDGKGVDVVYDSVGKDTFAKSLSCLKPRGMLVLFGQSSGVVAPIDPNILQQGSKFLTRPTLVTHIATREELFWRAGDVLGAIAKGDLDVRIGAEFPLADAAAAHEALEGRKTTGKVLLIP